jgi:hypothetical protein
MYSVKILNKGKTDIEKEQAVSLVEDYLRVYIFRRGFYVLVVVVV